MDIKEIWKASEASTEQVPEINSVQQLNSKGLKNPLKQAKARLLQNIIWSTLIGILYIPIIIYFNYWQIQLFIGITLIFTIWAVLSAVKLYKSIEANVSSNNLLSELKRVVNVLNQWMDIQCKVALFIYPFSVTGGYFAGGVLGSGKTVEEFISKPIVIYALLISIIVLTPLCYFLAKWMFNVAFGKIIKQMKKLIEELTEII